MTAKKPATKRPKATPKPTVSKATPKPKKGGPEAKAMALELLSHGFTATYVAAELKVRLNTVRAWRDSTEGQEYLAAARAKRAETLANAVGNAKKLLEENAGRAAQTLVDGLESKSPMVKLSSGRTILDRVGVPVQKEVKATVTQQGVDLSRFSTEELLEFDRLNRKARGDAA